MATASMAGLLPGWTAARLERIAGGPGTAVTFVFSLPCTRSLMLRGLPVRREVRLPGGRRSS